MNDEGSDTVPLIDTYGRASSVRYHRLLMPGGQYTYI